MKASPFAGTNDATMNLMDAAWREAIETPALMVAVNAAIEAAVKTMDEYDLDTMDGGTC